MSLARAVQEDKRKELEQRSEALQERVVEIERSYAELIALVRSRLTKKLAKPSIIR